MNIVKEQHQIHIYPQVDFLSKNLYLKFEIFHQQNCQSVSAYVQDLQAEMEDVINANPQSDEERHALFLRKRRYIDDLLEEVVIDGDRQIHVKFRADVLRLVQDNKVA